MRLKLDFCEDKNQLTFYIVRWFKYSFCNPVYSKFQKFCGSANTLLHIPLQMGTKMKKILSPVCVFMCVCVCVCVCECLYSSTWRHLPTARCLRHTWEVRIDDLVLWIFIWVLPPRSFIFMSHNVIFHFHRRNSSSLTNWRENDVAGSCEKIY